MFIKWLSSKIAILFNSTQQQKLIFDLKNNNLNFENLSS